MALERIQNFSTLLEASLDSKEYSKGLCAWNQLKAVALLAIVRCQKDKEQHLTLAKSLRSALELACALQIKREDAEEFHKSFALLEPLYVDYPEPLLPPSPHRVELYAFQLLKFLVDNRTGDFHMLLQRLSAQDFENPYLKFAIDLERCLMSGNYEKSMDFIRAPPHANFNSLCRSLIGSVRQSVADCLMRSHVQITTKRALQLLMLNSNEELHAFVESLNQRNEEAARTAVASDTTFQFPGTAAETVMLNPMAGEASGAIPAEATAPYICWVIAGDRINFVSMNEDTKRTIPVDQVIHYVLGYAAELERIV